MTTEKTLPRLQKQMNALQNRITELEAQIAALQNSQGGITALNDRVADIEKNSVLKFKEFLIYDTDENGYARALFKGINVQIVSGSGKTDKAKTNGLGNLIVGYNESNEDNPNDHSGSHNIITGKYNTYSSYGGLVVGFDNSIEGSYSTVTGGAGNKATGEFSSVSGGMYNVASGKYASVSGGHTNLASGNTANVSGGQKNTANGITSSSVSGGFSNTACGATSSVSGGNSNIASGSSSSVSGGQQNTASGLASTISGGRNDEMANNYGWRAGDLVENE